MRAPKQLLILAVALSACAGAGSDATTTTSTEVEPTPAPATTRPLVVGCPAEGRFIEGGVVDQVDNPGSDTTTIGLISWQADEACETFEITFETSEGAPATTPPSIRAEYVDDVGVIRLWMSARETVISDQLVETTLVNRIYVVRSIDGGMFIDFHLDGPSQARIVAESSPARLTLQLQPGIVEYTSAPAALGPVVLISPADDDTVPTTVTVEGYARTFESNVLILATQGDVVVFEENTTAADSVDTWGEFRASMDVVEGPIALFVGDENAETGRFDGVSIDLEAR